MNRIAVLADSHGNLPALEAVLADVEAAAHRIRHRRRVLADRGDRHAKCRGSRSGLRPRHAERRRALDAFRKIIQKQQESRHFD